MPQMVTAAFLTTSVPIEETNLRFVWVQEKVVLSEPVLKTGAARLEALEVVSVWLDEGSVKCHVISILVIPDRPDAVTTDKPADWCYICRKQDRSKNGPFWNVAITNAANVAITNKCNSNCYINYFHLLPKHRKS